MRGEHSPAKSSGTKPTLCLDAGKFGINNSTIIHIETTSHFVFDEAKAKSNSRDPRRIVMINNSE